MTLRRSSSSHSSCVITMRKSISQIKTISCQGDCSVIKNKKSRKDLSSHASLTLSTLCLEALKGGRLRSVYHVSCSTIHIRMKVLGEWGIRGRVFTKTFMRIILRGFNSAIKANWPPFRRESWKRHRMWVAGGWVPFWGRQRIWQILSLMRGRKLHKLRHYKNNFSSVQSCHNEPFWQSIFTHILTSLTSRKMNLSNSWTKSDYPWVAS